MLKKIIVAVDEANSDRFKDIISSLDSDKCMIKVGSISFNSIGHEAIYYSVQNGFEVFLDLKLHDIPNTVKKSIQGLCDLPIKMMTVHVSGGKDMLIAAMEAVKETDIKVFGVTALTSLNDADTEVIFKRNSIKQVDAMINLSASAGIHGVVCSPHEIELVKKKGSLLSITPGIRLKDFNDDQKRVMTPKQAIDKGANYIVIGRAITSSNNIEKSLDEIFMSIQ